MAYLFYYFAGEQCDGEQVYLAGSRDGLHWKDLCGGTPVLESAVGTTGLRDPFVIRLEDGSGFVLIATDLRIAKSRDWSQAVSAGSRCLAVSRSKDLVHWSDPVLVDVAPENAGCVWAPEAVYDENEQNYLVFFASRTPTEGGEPKQRIFSVRTKDFVDFTKPQLFVERTHDVIDSTMIREKGKWYRFSKDETAKVIRLETADSLDPAGFCEKPVEALRTLSGVEGPEIYRLPDGRFCLIVDRFAGNGGYVPLVCDCLEDGEFSMLPDDAFSMGEKKKRHGGVLPVSDAEFQRVLSLTK